MPLIIVFAGYNLGTGWYGLAVVSANMIGLCFVLTWLRLQSGSLWTGAILHASSNHLIQQFFDPMTAYTDRTKYILGEFGIGFTKWRPTSNPPICFFRIRARLRRDLRRSTKRRRYIITKLTKRNPGGGHL